MYCFLVGVSTGRELLSRVTGSARITRQLMPEPGLAMAECVIALPEFHGGLFVIHPERPAHRPLLYQHVDERWASIVYGDVDGAKHGDPAAEVLARWQRNGTQGVRQLEGCFGACIIDRGRREVHLTSDLIGCRSLRYWAEDDFLLVSTHDVALVATGLCSTELDEISACSAVCCDWSIGGKSMLKGVTVCSPHCQVQWHEAALKEVNRPPISFDTRVAEDDRRGRRAKSQELIELLRQRALARSDQEQRINLDLTAGADSRAVLAIMLSVYDPSKLQVLTTGRPEDLDARVAGSICRHYGLSHEVIEAPVPQTNDFIDNLSSLAFYLNGDTNGKRACREAYAYDVNAPIAIGGGGGEIFRGYYYPPGNMVAKCDARDAARYMSERRFGRLGKLTGVAQEARRAVAQRVRNQFELYATWTPEPWDWFDLFYLYERFARWALANRRAFQPPKYYLFDGPALVKSVYQLPSPIGKHCHLHQAVVRELSSYLYWLPINGKSLYVFQSNGFLNRAAKKADKIMASWATSVKARSSNGSSAPGTPHADAVRQLLKGEARAILANPGGVTAVLFGRDALDRIIEEHCASRVDHTETLGALFTLERWWDLVHEAATMAREHT